LPNQLFREIRNHPFCPPVIFGGYTLKQRGNLRNSHRILASNIVR
jgi:hypothetical protein